MLYFFVSLLIKSHSWKFICDKIREVSDGNELDIFSLILCIGEYLTDLTFSQSWSDERITFSFFNVISTSCVSSSLTKLVINLQTFDDCLYLLDGRLKHLSILIISMMKIDNSSSNIDNTVSINLTIEYKKTYL